MQVWGEAMPGNRKLQRHGSSTDGVEEAMGRLNMEESEDKLYDELGTYPDRPGEPNCMYYLRTGSCGYGNNCRFNHPSDAGQACDVKNTVELPERAGEPECGYYLKTGTCKYGSTCKYHHPKNRQVDVSMNILGLPMRQDARPCLYYIRTGSCKYGQECKFHHPQPGSPANILPIVGGGSSVAPSSGATSVSELSAASLPKATYFSGSFLQFPQNYIYLSPPQGWNTYMGGINSLSDSTIPTSPASNSQLPVPYLPERPDQPECRYFINHGSCKYGSDCKYHHPREKMPQLASSSVGPLGLPLRPGQAVCSNYILYGLCKYGPTCKFDHPMDAYSYAYSLAVPPLASAYTTPFAYRTPPMAPLSSTFSAKPSKSSDWVKKGPTASSKNLHLKTNGIGDSTDPSDSVPQSSEASSEIIPVSD